MDPRLWKTWFNCPVCWRFAKKVHCSYGDWTLCLLPPRHQWTSSVRLCLPTALRNLPAIYFPVVLWWLVWGCSNNQSATLTPMATSPIWGPKLCFITGVQCTYFWSSLQRLIFRTPSLLCSTASWILFPLANDCWTGNFFGAVSYSSVHPASRVALNSWEA